MSATTQRDLAMDAASMDWARALALARAVPRGWFGAQALAGAARYAPQNRVAAIADEAFVAALAEAEAYKRAAVLAWPLRALIERDLATRARQLLPEALGRCALIENPVSRSDAMFLLWQAVFPVQGHKSVMGALVKSCAGHWKADYLLRQTVEILGSEDEAAARQIAENMPAGKYQRQAYKRLAQKQFQSARTFFHERRKLP